MSYWIFKLSKQEQYPDDLGKTYVYDNRHSIRVSAGDMTRRWTLPYLPSFVRTTVT